MKGLQQLLAGVGTTIAIAIYAGMFVLIIGGPLFIVGVFVYLVWQVLFEM